MICNDCGRDIDQAPHRPDCKPRMITDIHDHGGTLEDALAITVRERDDFATALVAAAELGSKLRRERDEARATADERLDRLIRIAAVINNHFNVGSASDGALAAVAAILEKPWEENVPAQPATAPVTKCEHERWSDRCLSCAVADTPPSSVARCCQCLGYHDHQNDAKGCYFCVTHYPEVARYDEPQSAVISSTRSGEVTEPSAAFDECDNCEHWRGGHQPSGCRYETETARGLLTCNCHGFVDAAREGK